MASHPVNLTVRFLLEMAALVALGYWGWTQSEGAFRFVLALGIPLAAAVAWGTFAVPNDPSRSGQAPVSVPGLVRLGLELALFGFAIWALFDLSLTYLGWVMGIAVLIHYGTSYDRLQWLVKR